MSQRGIVVGVPSSHFVVLFAFPEISLSGLGVNKRLCQCQAFELWLAMGKHIAMYEKTHQPPAHIKKHASLETLGGIQLCNEQCSFK